MVLQVGGGIAPAGAVCMFCPAHPPTPASHTFTDSQRFVYTLCPRHYAPLRAWQLQGSPSGSAQRRGLPRGGGGILRMRETLDGPSHG